MPVPGVGGYTYNWQGVNYRFASAENLRRFEVNPVKYLPQYGGYCAYAMSINRIADIDPSRWAIVDGKLYLNNNLLSYHLWSLNKRGNIALADHNWPLYPKKPVWVSEISMEPASERRRVHSEQCQSGLQVGEQIPRRSGDAILPARFWHDARRLKVLGMSTASPGPAISTAELLERVEKRFGVPISRGTALAHRLRIATRHICRAFEKRHEKPRPGHSNPDLTAAAVGAALKEARLSVNDLSYLIGHTATPGSLLPPNIAQVADRLGYAGPYIELRQACSGFANALLIAQGLVSNAEGKVVGIVGSEPARSTSTRFALARITYTWFRRMKAGVMCMFKQTSGFQAPDVTHTERDHLFFYRYRGYSVCLINVGGYGDFISVIISPMPMKSFMRMVLATVSIEPRQAQKGVSFWLGA
jgi:YHS domain-containing protein